MTQANDVWTSTGAPARLPPPVLILGCSVVPWTLDQTVSEILRRMDMGVFTQHGAVNVAKLVNCQRDPELKSALMGCDMLSADGMGVVLAARILGHPLPARVAGIDLFLELLGHAERRGEGVYLLGAETGVVERAAEYIRRRHPALRIAGCHHGYFWDDEARVAEDIRASGASMLFVGITSPKKERFMHRWHDRLGVRYAMGVGGAFDVLAGKTRRSPLWMQKAGLEWLFRLVLEPRRMWRRYLSTNAMLVWLLLREQFKPKFHRGQ